MPAGRARTRTGLRSEVESTDLDQPGMLSGLRRLRPPDPRHAIRRRGFPYTSSPVPAAVEPAPDKGRVGMDFETEWARSWPAEQARRAIQFALIGPLTAGLAASEVSGRDRLDDLGERSAIFVANHHSHLDTPVVLSSLPSEHRRRVFVAAAADYFFAGRLTGTASALALNAIPIEREKASKRSIEDAIQLVDDGWHLLMFPEGGRSPDGWGHAFKGGCALIARRTGAPIVPIHLDGTDLVLPKGSSRPRPRRTTVTFGAPIASEGRSTSELTDDVELAVDALADEAATDWYQARRRAHAKRNPTLRGPELSEWRREWARTSRDADRRRRREPGWPFDRKLD